ncbi:2-(3-amino-3-carboxypropyl)histidine synthase subunit 1 [Rhizoctonia solani]|uniref:2-(3-amino-3-carboxypropyl)histidine synthase subunit 2 n=1 Tax=Rhizoctonia solani TaxID=456999 RepID=A0A8H7M6M5_9AGAM|nr:2-(3-amino-3-carboxypropyl)histidine synthase subunit 1 [Rhizoctonia solani]
MSIAQPPPFGAFSTAGEEAISRTIDIRENELTTADVEHENIDELFEVQETVRHIIDNDYKQVPGLDSTSVSRRTAGVSVPIYNRLKQLLGDGRNAYVLADTTYGSTSRLTVIYVFGKRPIDIQDCINQISLAIQTQMAHTDSTKSLILKRTFHTHIAWFNVEKIKEGLQKEFLSTEIFAPEVPTRYVPPPSASAAAPYAPADPDQPSEPISPSPSTPPINPVNGSTAVSKDIPTEESLILYIGGESLALTNFLLTHSSSEVISYDPQTRSTRRETGSVNKLLMRRYAIIQKARDADVIGILVGTLGVAKAQKKCYTISVGKLNPAKLANFMEIECFVLVACPENSVIESKEFYRPIVTPFELEIALGADRSWTGEYILDFDRILSSRKVDAVPDERDSDEDPDRPSFSLVTGTYRHAKRYIDPKDAVAGADSGGQAVALRNNESALSQAIATAGSEFLHSRSFQGLEQRLGQDEPAVLEQGRSGIAKGYEDVDHSSTS